MWWFLLGMAVAPPDNCDASCEKERRSAYEAEQTAKYDDMKCRGKAEWIWSKREREKPPSKPCPVKEGK